MYNFSDLCVRITGNVVNIIHNNKRKTRGTRHDTTSDINFGVVEVLILPLLKIQVVLPWNGATAAAGAALPRFSSVCDFVNV